MINKPFPEEVGRSHVPGKDKALWLLSLSFENGAL